MGDILLFKGKKPEPATPEDGSGYLPDYFPEQVAEQIVPYILRWINRSGEIAAGVPPGGRDQLFTIVAEMLVDRIEAELEFQLERQKFFEVSP